MQKSRFNRIFPILLLVVVILFVSKFAAPEEEYVSDNNASVATTVYEAVQAEATAPEIQYFFRNDNLLSQHFEKHGKEMGFATKEDYEAAASDVINNPDALSKTEKEDGDYVYYVESTNEFVILSKDGYIRTYFWPSAGISYYNRQ